MNKITLCIGDAHVEAQDDLKRFEVLGNFIVDKQPDHIVSIGDFLSLDSLSAWDLNKKAKMEGRRFAEELKQARKAVNAIMKPMAVLRNQQREKKRKIYNPRLISIMGNHEDRWFRYLDTHPELIDVVDLHKECNFEKFGWEKVDYRDYTYIEGVAFTHVPMNGTNQPISGQSMMINAARSHTTPVVFGHTHRLAIATDTRHGIDAKQITSINIGCFFEGVPDYAKGSLMSKDWWRGVVILEHIADGLVDVQTISLDNLYKRYGNCQII